MEASANLPEVHRAHPGARRTAAIGVLLAAGAGGLGLWGLRGWLAGSVAHSLDALLWSSFAVTMLVCSVCIVTAAMLWRIAAATATEARFPPAALRTVRDVPVRHGDAALRIATLCRAAAVLVALTGVLVLAWLGWTLRALS